MWCCTINCVIPTFINSILNTGGGTIDVQEGTVQGSGTVGGSLVNTSGTVAPGNSPGTLTVDGDFSQAAGGTLAIELAGTLQLIGTCADARMEAQILLTVFQYGGFDSVMITVGGRNLKQWFDTSGTVGDDEPYRRSQIRF